MSILHGFETWRRGLSTQAQGRSGQTGGLSVPTIGRQHAEQQQEAQDDNEDRQLSNSVPEQRA